MIINIIFYIVAFLMICSSLAVIFARNPMTSILFMVFTFVNASILFVLLHAEFIAMTLLVVYIGAILVLFIFIIMLLNIKKANKRKLYSKSLIMGIILSLFALFEVALLIKYGPNNPLPKLYDLNQDLNNSYKLSMFLYTKYSIVVFIIGVLLTVVMVGVIYINYQTPRARKQKMSSQVRRKAEDSVKTVSATTEKGVD